MKYLFILSLLFSVSTISAKGIEFFHGTWEEALEKAATEEKTIFVDAYAEWCGPCKRMARNVFTDAEVGDFYNQNFINLKIDMEKPENATFRKGYPVAAFPTLYFIDFTGDVVHQVKGAQSVEQFIQLGKSVVGKTDRSGFYAEAYENGDRSPELVYNYVKALNKVGEPSLKIANEYLKAQTDLTTPENLNFILEATTAVDSRIFDLLIEYRAAIEKVTSTQAVNDRIEQAAKTTLDKAIAYRSEELLKEAQDKMKKHHPEQANVFFLDSEMLYAKSVNDASRHLKAWSKYAKLIDPSNAEELSLLVTTLIKAFPNDLKSLTKAEKVAKTAADNGESYLSKYTYAQALLLNGKEKEAKQPLTQAMYYAKQSGNQMHVAMVMRLLREIEKNE
ncbi:MAG: thioredoxin family protein [Bacteroidota bacterium]